MPPRRAAQVDANVVAGLRVLGVSEESIGALSDQKGKGEGENTPDDFEVYADCWESVTLFLRVARMWVCMPRMVPVGLGVGFVQEPHHLDMCAVESVMNMMGIGRKARAGLLDDLLLMEGAALDAMQEMRGAQQA